MWRCGHFLLAPPKVVCLTMTPGGGAIAAALRQLGFKPYTFVDAFSKGRVETHPQEWCMVLDKKKPFNPSILDSDGAGAKESVGFDALAGPPCTLAFEAVLKTCPLSTRVILVEEEDKEGWARDAAQLWVPLLRQTERAARRRAGRHLHEMIVKMTFGTGSTRRALGLPSSSSSSSLVSAPASTSTSFSHSSFSALPSLVSLEALEEHIKAVVPRDRLLVFRHGDGWEPLCAFLGRPTPLDAGSGGQIAFPPRENGVDVVAHLCDRLQRAERVTMWAIACLIAALVVLYTPLYVQLRDVVRSYYAEYCVAFEPVLRENEGRSVSLRQAMVLAKNSTMEFEQKWREHGGVFGAAGEALNKFGGETT